MRLLLARIVRVPTADQRTERWLVRTVGSRHGGRMHRSRPARTRAV